MDRSVREMGYEIHLAQDRVQLWALVNMEMNLNTSQNVANFLTK